MAWHKQKQYDPSEAFLQNERQQKLLGIQLEKIDKQWYNKLRILSRDRLQTTSELIRLEDEKSQLEYFDENMEIHRMKEYTDICLKHMKELKRELTHDNFNFDNRGAILLKTNSQGMHLPRLNDGCFVTQSCKVNKKAKRPAKNRLKKRRKSNLMKSKIFSMSDSNLDKISKYKQQSSENDVTHSEASDKGETKLEAKVVPKSLLPELTGKVTVKRTSEQHRYLKEKMATALVLPTVNEHVPRQRKLSI